MSKSCRKKRQKKQQTRRVTWQLKSGLPPFFSTLIASKNSIVFFGKISNGNFRVFWIIKNREKLKNGGFKRPNLSGKKLYFLRSPIMFYELPKKREIDIYDFSRAKNLNLKKMRRSKIFPENLRKRRINRQIDIFLNILIKYFLKINLSWLN